MFGRLWCWVFFFFGRAVAFTLYYFYYHYCDSLLFHVTSGSDTTWASGSISLYSLLFSICLSFCAGGFPCFFFFSLFLFDASRVFSAWGCHFRGLYFVARFWFFCVSITIIIIKASFIIIEHTNFFLITVLLRLYISLFN